MQVDFTLPQVQQAIIAAVGSLIGALIAGFLTARWAVQKLRRERAFDRRLDWLEKVLRMLIDTRLALDNAVFWERQPEDAAIWEKQQEELIAERQGGWTEFHRRIAELWPVLNACPAYGTARMVAEISILGTSIKEGQNALAKMSQSDQQGYSSAYLSYMGDSSILMRGLEGQIEAEIRHHLGLEMFGPKEIERAEKRANARIEGRLTSDPLLPLKIVGRAFTKGFSDSGQPETHPADSSVKGNVPSAQDEK